MKHGEPLRRVRGDHHGRGGNALELVHQHGRALLVHVVRHDHARCDSAAPRCATNSANEGARAAALAGTAERCRSVRICAVFEPGAAHMSTTRWCGCTSRKRGGSMLTASWRLTAPCSMRTNVLILERRTQSEDTHTYAHAHLAFHQQKPVTELLGGTNLPQLVPRHTVVPSFVTGVPAATHRGPRARARAASGGRTTGWATAVAPPRPRRPSRPARSRHAAAG